MRATQVYVKRRFGIPHEFYVDYGGVFSVNLNNPEREKKTQWERAVASLGSKVIHSCSPQAKGRVERSNCTLHDHNKTYVVTPARQGDIHKTLLADDLSAAFCVKEERVLINDCTVIYKCRMLQGRSVASSYSTKRKGHDQHSS